MAYYQPSFGNIGERRKRRFNRKFLLVTSVVLFLIISIFIFAFYKTVLDENVWVGGENHADIEIPTGTDFGGVKEILFRKGIIIHRQSFELVSKWLKYDENVKPGRYLLAHGMNNLEVVRLLRSGAQTPVMVTFNNMRDVYQLAGRVSTQIEADSASIVSLVKDTAYLSFLGFDERTVPALFIPNSYEFYWTTNAESFISRMFQENKKFWNSKRIEKMQVLNMNEIQVSTLASIIEKETNKNEEKARMAGVYINRLRNGWRLQADPTLVFAVGDFEIRRVLDIHKTIESPYNTYKFGGLPPGPICIPSIASIDAVLNHENHKYFFFCAKDDLSGYHAFAETNAQHEMNAWRYRQALDRMNIRK
ncbi:MAG: endolytic transglycosylase MltG [Bacteroidetes bacterium]|nr:endolytic transglycosylase MltG [Bacteroidota bacterium]